jgi:hypothetical protein
MISQSIIDKGSDWMEKLLETVSEREAVIYAIGFIDALDALSVDEAGAFISAWIATNREHKATKLLDRGMTAIANTTGISQALRAERSGGDGRLN